MSDEQNTATPSAEEQELALLKDMADKMGISYRSNSTIEWLKAKITEKQTQPEKPEVTEVVNKVVDARSEKQKLRDELRAEQLKLVRCRIYNLNPQKNDLEGEIITVGNKYLGSVSKFIPFGEATDNGYHIPYIIYTELTQRRFQQISTKKGKDGQDVVTSRLVPEYSVEILPQLTKDELDELALKQSAAERLGA